MNIQKFQKEAKRTCPNLGEELNNYHMQMGVITEVGEFVDAIKKHIAYGKPLDVVNLGEELADITWYLVNEMRHSEILSENITEGEISLEKPNLLVAVDDITNWLISYLDATQSYDELLIDLRFIADAIGIDYFKALDNCINKLRVRFPDKFDTEKAINRDLTKERIELEK
jgi:NTP pyrophosphatase (non-canonical NTP hydrolase)